MSRLSQKNDRGKYVPKYKFYIIPHNSFVCDIDDRILMSGRRYRFYESDYKNAILLNIEEVLSCIEDCGNYYCNWRYKILPEDEFLKEWGAYKKNNIDKLKEKESMGILHIDDILHQPKRKKYCEWGILTRQVFGDVGIFGNYNNTTIYYSLVSSESVSTSAVLSYKKTENEIEFETVNSIYVVKKMKDINYINQLDELDKYKTSNEYHNFVKKYKEYEEKKLKEAMEDTRNGYNAKFLN